MMGIIKPLEWWWGDLTLTLRTERVLQWGGQGW